MAATTSSSATNQTAVMGGLSSVLWIGGPPAAGKSTVAQRIARRHGLRWYAADTRTWEHRDRAIAAGHPAAIRFERTPIPDRWSAPLRERFAMSLHRERGPMVVDDLRALPPTPLTIAEGTPITPSVVGTSRYAVWLFPTPEEQRARLKERGLGDGVRELYEQLFHEIEAEVDRYGVRKLVVDDSQDVEETVAAVEALFADALDRGPTAATVEDRRELLRYANRAIVSQYLRFYERPWARELGNLETTVLPFSCECGLVDCSAQVELAVADYADQSASRLVLSPQHRVA